MDEDNFEYYEKDSRHNRIKRGADHKKRDNFRESVVRQEKTDVRAEQSRKDRGINIQYIDVMDNEPKKKIKKGISSRLTKEQKQALYEQDELNQQKVKKGKAKHIQRVKMA